MPNISDIRDLPKVNRLMKPIWAWHFWKDLGYSPSLQPRRPRVLDFRKYHLSTKTGPNGPALISSIADLSLIRLNKRLLDSICELGGKLLTHRITGLVERLDFVKSCHPKYPEYRLRKLSYFPDKEEKVRVVAILDYFSQAALYPFHLWLYRVLRRIPQDCTFNQGSFR
jgi:hypothetical protein